MSENRNTEQLRAGFEQFYQAVLEPKFAEIETTRKKYLRFFILSLFIIFVVIPLICIGLFGQFLLENVEGSQSFDALSSDKLLFGLLIIIAIVSSPIFLYKKKAKNIVMPEFIKYFGDFEYVHMKTIARDVVEKSMLFDDFNVRKGDDFFYGVYLDTKMAVSEESMSYVERRNKKTYVKNIFNGMIIQLEMNKKFSSQTVVFKDNGMFNFLNVAKGLQKVALEDSVFEKEFEVYSSDQLDARYLLTTAFMERMLTVRNAYKTNKIQFSFFDNCLLIAIDTKKDMFESTSLFRKTTDKKIINQVFEQFISVMSIIEFLKLNQRTGF